MELIISILMNIEFSQVLLKWDPWTLIVSLLFWSQNHVSVHSYSKSSHNFLQLESESTEYEIIDDQICDSLTLYKFVMEYERREIVIPVN